ncbi:MAG: hypothetical protein IKE64_01565 [Thermoguttaceae bacterium]|nr:hypothetical protein [Thermoguttaceae bacterium]
MKSSPFFLLILCALFLPALSPLAAAKEPIPLDKETVEKITAAHRLLEENVNNVSGRTNCWRVDGKSDGPVFSTDGLKEVTRAKFYRRGESIRVEYSHKDAEGNDVEIDKDYAWIFIYTPSVAYEYFRLSTTSSSPVSNLKAYTTPNDAGKNVWPTTEGRVRLPLASLTHLTGQPVLEVLQYPITQWENKPYRDISDALWITCENPSANSELDTQHIQMILSPSEDYAVLFFKIVTKIVSIQGEVRSIVSDVYGRVPIMIDERCQSTDPDSNDTGLNSREVIELEYSDDRSFSSSVFTADSLGEDGESIAKIVIRDGKEVRDRPQEIPTSISGPDIPLTPGMVNPVVTRPLWPWWRYLTAVSGLVLVVVGIFQLWKKNHSPS